MTPWFIVVVVLVVAGHFGVRALRSTWEISVLVEDGQCQFRKGVAHRDREAYESFFLRDLDVEGRLEVFVRTESSGRLVIKTLGSLDMGQKQRLRNFLIYGIS